MPKKRDYRKRLVVALALSFYEVSNIGLPIKNATQGKLLTNFKAPKPLKGDFEAKNLFQTV